MINGMKDAAKKLYQKAISEGNAIIVKENNGDTTLAVKLEPQTPYQTRCHYRNKDGHQTDIIVLQHTHSIVPSEKAPTFTEAYRVNPNNSLDDPNFWDVHPFDAIDVPDWFHERSHTDTAIIPAIKEIKQTIKKMYKVRHGKKLVSSYRWYFGIDVDVIGRVRFNFTDGRTYYNIESSGQHKHIPAGRYAFVIDALELAFNMVPNLSYSLSVDENKTVKLHIVGYADTITVYGVNEPQTEPIVPSIKPIMQKLGFADEGTTLTLYNDEAKRLATYTKQLKGVYGFSEMHLEYFGQLKHFGSWEYRPSDISKGRFDLKSHMKKYSTTQTVYINSEFLAPALAVSAYRRKTINAKFNGPTKPVWFHTDMSNVVIMPILLKL